MVRKLFRAGMWGIKGVLLFAAVGALLGVPLSWERPWFAEVWRCTVETEHVSLVRISCGWGNGRLGVQWHMGRYGDYLLSEYMQEAAIDGESWNLICWEGIDNWEAWERLQGEQTWGPFRWKQSHWNEIGAATSQSGVSLPCWLLAITSGVWPLASLALFIRRRRRLRNLRRSGCCLHCGYDLRAASADPAARCPGMRDGAGGCM